MCNCERILTTKEVAYMLGFKVQTVWNKVSRGEIPRGPRPGAFYKSDIDRLIDKWKLAQRRKL